MSLLDTIKAAQLQARKDRNTVKASLLTTLITEVTTTLASTLRTEAVNAVNKQLGRKEITSDVAESEIAKLDATFDKDWLPTDDQVLTVTGKFVANAKQAVKVHTERGETSKAEEAQHEVDILTTFLPKQLSDDELREVISNFRASAPGSQIGAIMKHLQSNFKGLYDAQTASAIARE